MRIPTIPPPDSDGRRHPFSGKSICVVAIVDACRRRVATRDVQLCFFIVPSRLRESQLRAFLFSHGLSFQFNAVVVVNKSVKNGGAQDRVGDDFRPVRDRHIVLRQ